MLGVKEGPKTKVPNAGKGRPKGTPNKTTAAVKEALTLAFKGLGGVPALVKWAKTAENRGEFYKLWAKMLPQEVTGADGQDFIIRIVRDDPPESG